MKKRVAISILGYLILETHGGRGQFFGKGRGEKKMKSWRRKKSRSKIKKIKRCS